MTEHTSGDEPVLTLEQWQAKEPTLEEQVEQLKNIMAEKPDWSVESMVSHYCGYACERKNCAGVNNGIKHVWEDCRVWKFYWWYLAKKNGLGTPK